MTAQDFTVAEHVNLLRSSASPFVQALFGESEGAAEAPKSGARGRASGSAFKLNSVGSQFRKQLQVHARLPRAQQGSDLMLHNALMLSATHPGTSGMPHTARVR